MALAHSNPLTTSGTEHDRLNGWKEIAAHLGKAVRTVQRWEKEYGLPIQRLGRDGGEIILASRAELDEWMRMNVRRTQAAEEAPTVPSEPPSSALKVTPRVFRRGWWIAAGIALAALATWALVPSLSPPRPARWVVEDGALNVQDRFGVSLWSPPIGFRVEDAAYAAELPDLTKVVIRDIDGDKAPEVIFGARAPKKDPRSAFYLFDADGLVRKVIRPSHRVRYGAASYSGPWLPHLAFVLDRPGQTPAIFLTFVEGDDFPTLLMEVDSNGDTIAEYWSDGYVESVAFVTWHNSSALFVTAANNDASARGGSVAIFPGGHARGSAPSGADGYRCQDCPAGEPAEFFSFPRRCMSALIDGTAPISEARITLAGEIVAHVSDGLRQVGGGFKSIVIYTLTADLRISRIELVGGIKATHEAMEQDGVFPVAHTLSDDLPALLHVRHWSGGRWVEMDLAAPLDQVLALPPGLAFPASPPSPSAAGLRQTTPVAIRR